MGSKYIDLALIAFMGYFAFTRFSSGQTGFGIFFTVLALLNILTLVMKINKEKETNKDVR